MLWYLSYAGESGFNGGLILEAASFADAIIESHRQKLSPGGEVLGFPVPPDWEERLQSYVGRLLSETETRKLLGDEISPLEEH